MLGMLGKCIITIPFSVMSINEKELGIRLLNVTGDLVYFAPSSFSVVDFSKSIELIN